METVECVRNRKPAAFLDRDGVLTVERGRATASLEEMETFPYAAECVARLRDTGYWTIVLTNQSGVARGLFPEEELLRMNRKILDELHVDALYACPHHPEGIVPRYAKVCDCRKPGIGMIRQAMREFEIDLARSVMIGDRASDIQLGRNAGIRTILLNSGYGEAGLEMEVSADAVLADLREAVSRITEGKDFGGAIEPKGNVRYIEREYG